MQKIYYTQTIPDPALYQSRNVSVKAQRYAKYYTYFIFFEFTPHLCSWNSPQKQSFSLGALINFPHLLHPIIFCLIFSGTDIDRPVVCSASLSGNIPTEEITANTRCLRGLPGVERGHGVERKTEQSDSEKRVV